MKRLLYGTTAMVAASTLMAGPAAAQLEASLNGYMEQWFGISDQDVDSTAGGADVNSAGFSSDTEVHFNASVTLDNGMKVQYHVELEGNTDGDQIDESYLRLTANWGQVVFGSENSAAYAMGYGPTQMGVTTLSGDVTQWISRSYGAGASMFRTPAGSANWEAANQCNDDKRLTYYTPRFSGFQFGASYAANCASQDVNGVQTDATQVEHNLAFGANFSRKFDQVNVRVSASYARAEEDQASDSAGGDDPEVIGVGANFGFGGFTIGGHWGNTIGARSNAAGTVSEKNMGYSVGASYANGPWGVSLVWLHGEREGNRVNQDEDEHDIIELGAKYKLGPGVELRGSVYYADFEDESGGGASGNEGWAVVGGMRVSF